MYQTLKTHFYITIFQLLRNKLIVTWPLKTDVRLAALSLCRNTSHTFSTNGWI